MSLIDRLRGAGRVGARTPPGGRPVSASTGGAVAAAGEDEGRLPDGLWPGIAPAGFPPSVDVDRPALSFAVNAEELRGVRGLDRLGGRLQDQSTDPATRAFLAVIAAAAADLRRRGLTVVELMLPEPAAPWQALPVVPIVARRAPAASAIERASANVAAASAAPALTGEPSPNSTPAAPTAIVASSLPAADVPVLMNPVPVTERELLSFFVFAGRVRRAPRFERSPIAVYGPAPLPGPFARLADVELPGLLEGDLAPEIATRTPTPSEGARAFADAIARRSTLRLDLSTSSLARLDDLLGRYPGTRYGNVARVALAAYVGEVAVAHAGAQWEGKLPLATLRMGTKNGAPLQMAREFLPLEGAPRLAEFVQAVRRQAGGSPGGA